MILEADIEASKLWQKAQPLLEQNIRGIPYTNFIKKLTPIDIIDNILVLKVTESFIKSTIDNKYSQTVLEVINQIDKSIKGIEIILNENDIKNASKHQSTNARRLEANLNPKYIFDSFVSGKSNDMAYAAAINVAKNPTSNKYNPLFFYGGVGLGKTHLMHAIGNYIFDENADFKIRYVAAETFTNEMISGIRNEREKEFRDMYRDVDLLLVDDVQFMAGKEGTQEQFFHAFNDLYNAGKQIVITSDKPPKEIKKLEERLVSRFGMGLILDITLPDYETRTAILESKIQRDNIKVPPEVVRYISKNIVSNIRELEGALNKVEAYAKLVGVEINMDIAERSLRDLIDKDGKQEITVPFIQEVVANYYGITADDITSKKRTTAIAYPRQIAMYLSRKMLELSTPKIGELFGGRDHSTIIHGCDKIVKDLENNTKLQKEITEIENKIKD